MHLVDNAAPTRAYNWMCRCLTLRVRMYVCVYITENERERVGDCACVFCKSVYVSLCMWACMRLCSSVCDCDAHPVLWELPWLIPPPRPFHLHVNAWYSEVRELYFFIPLKVGHSSPKPLWPHHAKVSVVYFTSCTAAGLRTLSLRRFSEKLYPALPIIQRKLL